jgi:hypothetical protein
MVWALEVVMDMFVKNIYNRYLLWIILTGLFHTFISFVTNTLLKY